MGSYRFFRKRGCVFTIKRWANCEVRSKVKDQLTRLCLFGCAILDVETSGPWHCSTTCALPSLTRRPSCPTPASQLRRPRRPEPGSGLHALPRHPTALPRRVRCPAPVSILIPTRPSGRRGSRRRGASVDLAGPAPPLPAHWGQCRRMSSCSFQFGLLPLVSRRGIFSVVSYYPQPSLTPRPPSPTQRRCARR